MLQPVEQTQIKFVSDGVSTVLTFDLTQPPVRMDFSGGLPVALRNLTLTNGQAVANPTVTATLLGSTVTATFATPPPQNDVSAAAVLYTLALELVYA